MYNFVVGTLKFLFRWLYHHQVYGLENLTENAAILAANHSSYLDPPLLSVSCPAEVYFLARASLFRFPLFGWLIRHLNTLPVTQDTRDTKMLKEVLNLLADQKKVALFPEGHRSFDGSINPLEKGAASIALRAKCPIVPVYISGAHEIWPRRNRFPKLHGTTACRFGPPIWPDIFNHLDRKRALSAITQELELSLRKLEAEAHQ
jgi:1-acyl-sn-glycerol-3-phosphate acyltransferase